MTTRKYAHVVNIFFVLVTVGIEIECGRIRGVATCLIRHNGDVVADLTLVRVTFERVECIGHGNISRPRHAGISTKGIEKL